MAFRHDPALHRTFFLFARKIEKGERTRVRTLEILAQSHGLSLKAYLDRIADLLNRDQPDARMAL